jgi:hypothetical protein
MIIKNIQVKAHFMEVSSKMVKMESIEEVHGTSNAATVHSPPPPAPDTEDTGEMETLRSKVRCK